MASRVLLIDDDTRLPELLGSYLEQNGVILATPPTGHGVWRCWTKARGTRCCST